jgi:hypothetical protein
MLFQTAAVRLIYSRKNFQSSEKAVPILFLSLENAALLTAFGSKFTKKFGISVMCENDIFSSQ